MTQQIDAGAQPEHRWYGNLELIAAIILGLAGTLAAFSAYQGALADGDSLEKYTESTQALGDANLFYSNYAQELQGDQQLFAQYIVLLNQDEAFETDIAESILEASRDDNLIEAISWWFDDPDAVTPFDEDPDNPYFNEWEQRADDTQDEAEALQAEGSRQNEIGDQFELAGVILALTLFFAGISTLLSSRKVSVSLLLMATVSLLGGGWIVTQALSA